MPESGAGETRAFGDDDRERLRSALGFPEAMPSPVAQRPPGVEAAPPSAPDLAGLLLDVRTSVDELRQAVASVSERMTMLEMRRAEPTEMLADIDRKLEKLFDVLPDLETVAEVRRDAVRMTQRMEHLKETLDRWGV